MNKKLALMLILTSLICFSACTKADVADDSTEGKADGEVSASSSDTENVNAGTVDEMWSDIDVSALPETEEGVISVDESFSTLTDKVVGRHESENFTMVLTFYFEDGKAVNGHVEGTYKNLAQAKSVYDSYLKNTDYYANVKRSDGTITYTHTEKSFEAYSGKTVEEIKQSLTESGFEVEE